MSLNDLLVLYYRVIQVKVDETKQLFQIENIDIFFFKWYFDYCKGVYGTTKIQKKNSPDTQNLCQSQISHFETTVFF